MTEAPLIPEGLDATLVLLRHGESTFIVEGRFQGQADSPLSATGLRQAELAARRLAEPARSPILPIPLRPPVEIVHSPLLRTTQTASRVAVAVAGRPALATVQMRPEPGIAEIAQGVWEGMTVREVEERFEELLAAWRRRPLDANAPGGERVRDVAIRVRAALGPILATLAAAGAPGTIDRSNVSGYPGTAAPDAPWSIVVGHAGAFRVLLLALLGLPLEAFWSFPFDLAAISVIEFQGGRPVLRAHNLTAHLGPMLEEQAIAESDERQRTGAL